jgi:beta-glucuronidase
MIHRAWMCVSVVLSVASCGWAQVEKPVAGMPPYTLLVASDQRPAQSLDGEWHIIADPYLAGLYSFHGDFNANGYFKDEEGGRGSETGNKLIEYNFQKSPTIKVPGDWNTQQEWLKMYEGALWYERHFTYTPQPGHRAFLHLGAANYKAIASVNGKFVCQHEGGFTPFDCEITSVVKPGQNDVVIEVDDSREADGIPTLKTDWYNYGGLTRDVSVVTVPDAFIDDFELHLDRPTRSKIEGYVHVEGAAAGTKVSVALPEAGAHVEGVTDGEGRVAVTLPATGLTLWSPETPKLYKVEMAVNGGDKLVDTMGFRTIEVQGTEILLNGKPLFLHGVCIHAEAPIRGGRANNQQDADTLLGWVKELGGNFARLAHYPHDERMERTADRMGILLWSEVPVYWAVEFDKEYVFEKAKQQMHDNIRRDRDKASVILWSIANETPSTEARTAFLSRSAAYVKEQDPTRLVTAALLVHGPTGKNDDPSGNTKYIDDPLGKSLDVIGFNEYIGWYEGGPDRADTMQWKVAYEKPLIVSEFGAGAKYGLHGPDTERWTEEYQANVYKHQFGMLNRIPQLRGMTPWVLMDFRSPVRQLPGIQDGYNRKGLISNLGQKKQAFFVLQKAYKTNAVGKAQ